MKKVLLFSLLVLGSVSLNAQKIAVIEGDLKALKGEKFFDIEYDYSDMSVGRYDKEEDYVEEKRKEYNEKYKDKEPGKGDDWKEKWYGDRKGRFQPMFEELLNKNLSKLDIFVGPENSKAKYKMIIRTTHTEPGFNVYVTKKPAMVDVTVTFVENDNPENVVCKLVSKNNPGRTYGMGDFDTGLRISEAYAMCGKGLGKYFSKAWK